MDMTVEVPELPELTFDEASHIYRLNGDIIPSVSKLMEPLKDQCYGGTKQRRHGISADRHDGRSRVLPVGRLRRHQPGACRDPQAGTGIPHGRQ